MQCGDVCGDYDCFYFVYCVVLVCEDCVCDDCVVDVQFDDVVDCGDLLYVCVVQFMVCIDFQVKLCVGLYVCDDMFVFVLLFCFVVCFCVVVCMQFDYWCVCFVCSVDLCVVWVDEQ